MPILRLVGFIILRIKIEVRLPHSLFFLWREVWQQQAVVKKLTIE